MDTFPLLVLRGVPDGRLVGNLKQKKIRLHFTNKVIKEKEGGEGDKRRKESWLLSLFEVRVYGYVYCQR